MQKSGELRLDKMQGQVYKNGEQLKLGTLEYQMLLLLMENAGRIVRREQLLRNLWDDSGKFVENNTLSVSMSRLRKKIGAEYIETTRGFEEKVSRENTRKGERALILLGYTGKG